MTLVNPDLLKKAIAFYSRCPDGQYDLDVVVPALETLPALEQEVSRLRGLLEGKSILEDCTLLLRDEKPLFRFPADADGHCFVNLSNYTFVPSELLQDGQAGRWSERLWGGDDA